MVVVVVLVVLIVAGVAAGLVFRGRSKRRTTGELTISSADRIEASMPSEAPQQPARPAAPTVDEPEREAGVDEDASPSVDDDAAARFRRPGERSSHAMTEPEPTNPALVVHHLEAVPTTDAQATESEPEPVPESDQPIDPVIVLTNDAVVAPRAEIDRDQSTNVDDVVSALIERVRNSASNDLLTVVSEMVDRDLDADQMEEVLSHLVERERAQPRRDELTLSGPDVPQRPGRLSAFGDMGEGEKRRVIIRVLCLLIARSEDDASHDDERPLYTVELPPPSDQSIGVDDATAPTARDLWGEPDDNASEANLPARRRRLARSRR